MVYQTSAYFLFAILASVYNLWFADRLRKNFYAPYLNTLFYFLVAYNLANFINWIGYMAFRLLFFSGNRSASDIVPLAYSLLGIFSTPILLLGLYFFLTMFIELLDRRIPSWLNRLLVGAMGLVTLLSFWSYFSHIIWGDTIGTQALHQAFDIFGTYFIVFIPSVFLFINLFQKNDFKRRRNLAFILAFQIIMVVIYLTPISWLRFNWKNIRIDLLAVLFFVLPLIPLWVAKKYQQKYIRLYPDSSPALPDLQTVCRDFGISRRECEVLEMVIAGKSHREIEDTLFISGRTIKNHLYNSYKKLGVKNRVQLLNLFHNLQKKPQRSSQQ